MKTFAPLVLIQVLHNLILRFLSAVKVPQSASQKKKKQNQKNVSKVGTGGLGGEQGKAYRNSTK